MVQIPMVRGWCESAVRYAHTVRRASRMHRSIEAARMANTAARLMDAYQRGLLTLDRMRNGGRQVVTVQHQTSASPRAGRRWLPEL